MRNAATPIIKARATGSDVRTLLSGKTTAALQMTRQAYRVHEADSDELAQLTSGHEYWVGIRLGERFTIWACQSRDAAEDKFEELMADGAGWTEARPQTTGTDELIA